MKLVARLFDFQPWAGYASELLPHPLSGAAGLTGGFTLLFLGLYGPVRASTQPVRPAGHLARAGSD